MDYILHWYFASFLDINKVGDVIGEMWMFLSVIDDFNYDIEVLSDYNFYVNILLC